MYMFVYFLMNSTATGMENQDTLNITFHYIYCGTKKKFFDIINVMMYTYIIFWQN